MRAVQVVTPTGPADIEVRDVDEPTPGPDDVLIEVHRVGVSFPDLLLSRGEYQLKPDPPFSLGVDVAGTVVSGAGFEPGQRVAAVFALRRGAGAGRHPGDVHVRAPRLDLVRRGRGAADELPHRPVRPRRARAAAARRDGARARRRGRRRHRHHPGRPRHGRPHHRGGQHRARRPRSPARPAPTRWCCSTASRTPSRSSPRATASTWCSTWWAATSSPTRCARSRPRAGCSSSASPPARASPRSRSTGCCSTTSTCAASAGARSR